MKKIFYTIFFCLVILGCSNKLEEFDVIANKAASIMDSEPNLALQMLQQYDINALKDKEQRAKMSLLLTKALDKTDFVFTSDTVIDPAVEYYRKNGSATDRANAYFYKARLNKYMGNIDESIKWLVKAQVVANETCDDFLKGLMHTDKANLLDEQFDFDEAIDEYRLAMDIFKNIGHKKYEIGCLSNIANLYYMKSNCDSAQVYYDRAAALAKELNDTSVILANCIKSVRVKFEQTGDAASSLKQLNEYFVQYGNGEPPTYTYVFLSNLYIETTTDALI